MGVLERLVAVCKVLLMLVVVVPIAALLFLLAFFCVLAVLPAALYANARAAVRMRRAINKWRQ